MPAWQSNILIGLAVAVLVYEIASRGALTRTYVRNLFRFFAALEVAIQKLARRIVKPRYALVGDCVKCGKCCQEIVFNPPKFVRQTAWLTKMFMAYHRMAHNFSPVGRSDEGAIIFSCGHLQSDGRCGIHKWRPFLCRNFPIIPWFEAPKLLPYCSYQVASREVTQMKPRASLRILNAQVAVHHPSPNPNTPETEHFHLVDVSNRTNSSVFKQ